jgi:hypothetical protein
MVCSLSALSSRLEAAPTNGADGVGAASSRDYQHDLEYRYLPDKNKNNRAKVNGNPIKWIKKG